MKKCIHCQQKQDYSLFNKCSNTKDGFQTWCRKCQANRYSEYRKDPEAKKKIHLRYKKYYEKNRERMIQRTREYEKKYPLETIEKRKKRNFRNKFIQYGITEEIFEQMKIKQGQKCAMCFQELHDKNTHIDHCHKTGRVRSLLCTSCNMSLGFYEKENWLQQVQAYLRETEIKMDKEPFIN
jgi:hypothetical protein